MSPLSVSPSTWRGARQSLHMTHCGILKGEIKVTVRSRGARARLPSGPPHSSSLARGQGLVIRPWESTWHRAAPLRPTSLLPTGREHLFQSPLSCSGHSSLDTLKSPSTPKKTRWMPVTLLKGDCFHCRQKFLHPFTAVKIPGTYQTSEVQSRTLPLVCKYTCISRHPVHSFLSHSTHRERSK